MTESDTILARASEVGLRKRGGGDFESERGRRYKQQDVVNAVSPDDPDERQRRLGLLKARELERRA